MGEEKHTRRNLLFLVRAVIFALIFTLLCGCALYVLTPKQDFGAGGLIQMYLQEENTIDVLSVGTSMTYAGINTGVLWDNWGIAAFDMAGAEQQYWGTYYWLLEVLETQTPKLIILDAKASTYPNDETKRGRIIQATCAIRNQVNRVNAIREMADEKDVLSHILLFPQVHNNWKKLTEEDFSYGAWTGGRSLNWKGFIENGETEKHSKPNLVWTSTKKKINDREAEYFLKICDLVQSKGIDMLIVAYPNPDYANDHMYYNALWALADERGIPHLNLNDPEGKYRFLYSSEFADWQHVNTKGSIKLTKILGQILDYYYDLPDRRGDERWQSWEDCSNEWKQEHSDFADQMKMEET